MIVVEATSGFGILRKQPNGHYSLDEQSLKKVKPGISQAYFEPDGVIWIGTSDILYRYDPRVKKNYRAKFPALIRSVTAGEDEPLFNGTYYDPASKKDDLFLKSTLEQPASLIKQLSYENNRVVFTFAAAFFEQAEKNQFRYQLVGFDEEWSEWTTERKKEYTNLPENDYRFVVEAKNIFDVKSEPAVFRFSILPPWYRTVQAYLGYALLLLGLMVAGSRIYNRRLVASRKRLKKIVDEQTEQVRQQKDQLLQANDALWGEMQLAKKIQTVLLPEDPRIEEYEIAACMQPADEVGGDYYDVINIRGTDWIVIGDVSGHGVPAGLVMMMVQTAIHSVLDTHADEPPARILSIVNRVIHGNIQKVGGNKYMTITIFSVQPHGAMVFSGLHQDILIYRAASQTVERVQTAGMWIGVMEEIEEIIRVDELTLAPNDVMLIYTDGITEAMDEEAGEMFSVEKLIGLLEQSGTQSVDAIERAILREVEPYTCNDDITFMVLKRT